MIKISVTHPIKTYYSYMVASEQMNPSLFNKHRSCEIERLKGNLRERGRVVISNSFQTEIQEHKLVIWCKAFYVGRKAIKNWPEEYELPDNTDKIIIHSARNY